MDEFTSVCEEAAKSGGKVLLEWLGAGPANRKRAARSGHRGRSECRNSSLPASSGRPFPEHAIVGEEDLEVPPKTTLADEYTWFIDPLDGTTNYIHGFPHFCVSVALVQRAHGAAQLIAGTIYDPCRDECFTASAGAERFSTEPRCVPRTAPRWINRCWWPACRRWSVATRRIANDDPSDRDRALGAADRFRSAESCLPCGWPARRLLGNHAASLGCGCRSVIGAGSGWCHQRFRWGAV